MNNRLQVGNHAEQRFRALLEAAPDAIVILNRHGMIELINSQAERMFGYKRSGLLGKPLSILFPDRFSELHANHREGNGPTVFKPGIGTGQVLVARRADGTGFPVEIGVNPLETEEGMLIISSIRDVTERTKAEDEIRRLNSELEDGVKRRTAALTKANDELRREISARHRLEREILEISEREQQRIGQDLHDDLGQRLVGIAYLCQALANSLAARSDPEALYAGKITELLKNALSLTRSLARGLHPVALKSGGLVAALGDLAERTSEIFQIHCLFAGPANEPALPYTAATHLYRIAQEAVTNAVNHGGAAEIGIDLSSASGDWVLAIRDNGRGMPRLNPRRTGMGLRIMKYRADVIGAVLSIENPPSGGTLITCSLPRAG